LEVPHSPVTRTLTGVLHAVASIPRLQGEARYAIGSTVRGARNVGLTQQNMGNVLDTIRFISAQRQNQNPSQRKPVKTADE
jgi:hypothetical protein